MTTFDRISLCLLAVLVCLGLAAPFALAARARRPALIITTFAVGTWALVTLILAAVMLG